MIANDFACSYPKRYPIKNIVFGNRKNPLAKEAFFNTIRPIFLNSELFSENKQKKGPNREKPESGARFSVFFYGRATQSASRGGKCRIELWHVFAKNRKQEGKKWPNLRTSKKMIFLCDLRFNSSILTVNQ